jgi:hypothetical protein
MMVPISDQQKALLLISVLLSLVFSFSRLVDYETSI